MACVPGVIAVRDSKNPAGPVLVFARGEVLGLLADVQRGCFGT